jgi:putative DNA methylase
MSTSYPVKSPKKLIEVALPLDAINAAAAREKSIRHGHPSTLHLWWARRPLAAARAVIFGQLVNDPSWKWELDHSGEVPPSHLKASWAASRKRLFAILEDLVKWESTTNEDVLEKARAEIRRSWRETCDLNKDHPLARELFNPDKLPALHDPLAGGGALPLEAQRLGLEAYASDLNPVAVLINKAMIEIPPKFAGRPPVGPLPEGERGGGLGFQHEWPNTTGLAEDIRRYGAWLCEEALKRIGHLYPPVEVTADMAKDRPDLRPLVGQTLTPIAWLWARTVRSPNPAFRHVEVPLASSFLLSSKEGKETYVKPIVEGDRYHFTVKIGRPPVEAKDGTKLARGANFRCLLSGAAIEPDYIKAEGMAKRMGARLMAVAAEGSRGRVYLPPTWQMEAVAAKAEPTWKPELSLPNDARNFWTLLYGLTTYADLFTRRQLVALATFSDLVSAAREKIRHDAECSGLPNDDRRLDAGGTGVTAYADAIATYLGIAVARYSNSATTICAWNPGVKKEDIRFTFSRQALPMTWDYAEGNPFSKSSGNLADNFETWLYKAVLYLHCRPVRGTATLADAASQELSRWRVVSTDPPYYDNIGYADLSDFFYVWLRRSLRAVYPSIFSTMATPKAEELVATPYRHGSKETAERFFLDGMTRAMRRIAEQAHPGAPVTIYYAFKQSETEAEHGTNSTGWETFLEAVNRAGLALTGTWPMRTEREGRSIGIGTNSLASSIILVCRPRPTEAPTTSRRAFIRELDSVLPDALDVMIRGSGEEQSPVAPVDLSQAIIGPGMAVFTKYAVVLEADGSPMSVRTALQLINRFLAEADFDSDTQFCLHWFEQHGWKDGRFGEADTLARAKGTSVDGVKQAGVLRAAAGVVGLVKWADYPSDWDPGRDQRLPVWEVLHQLIRVFKHDGESGAGAVLAAVQAKAEPARQLAYRLYTLCERAGWAEDARAYNELITGWSAIESAAAKVHGKRQARLPGHEE